MRPIEYGLASAVRNELNPDLCRELTQRYIAFDTETTGLDPEKDHIVELGAVVFENGVPTASFQSYVNSGITILEEASAINHISLLELDRCYYFGLHPSNLVQMHGYLNRDKQKMLDEISRRRQMLSDRLQVRPVRGGEGAILNA